MPCTTNKRPARTSICVPARQWCVRVDTHTHKRTRVFFCEITCKHDLSSLFIYNIYKANKGTLIWTGLPDGAFGVMGSGADVKWRDETMTMRVYHITSFHISRKVYSADRNFLRMSSAKGYTSLRVGSYWNIGLRFFYLLRTALFARTCVKNILSVDSVIYVIGHLSFFFCIPSRQNRNNETGMYSKDTHRNREDHHWCKCAHTPIQTH